MKDFSELVFHCSHLLYLMADGKEKSPMVLLEEAKKKLEDKELKYRKLKDKTTITAHKKIKDMNRLQKRIEELEPIKHEEVLSESGKHHLTRLYGWYKYRKWTLPTGGEYSPIEKGLSLEPAAIDMVSELDGVPYHKNIQRYKDDYITGMPDILKGEIPIDIKCSWNLSTFLTHLYKPLPARYWWQMQGYLSLTGADVGEVSFCLLSSPEDVIRAEIEKKGLLDRYPSMDWLIQRYTYDDIPINERRIKFIVERDDEAIEKIPKKVKKGRQFLEFLQNRHITPEIEMSDL